jgi:hypothetical protein
MAVRSHDSVSRLDLSANNYETRAENWLDHNNIGESNIFWPITWSRPDSRVVTHLALSQRLPPWPVSPGLCEPDRAGNLAHHRRPDLPGPGHLGMPA